MATTSSHGEQQNDAIKVIWKTFWILLVLTLVELVIGFYIFWADLPDAWLKYVLRTLIILLMLYKAYFIVAYFMHLKHEVRNLISTILVPLLLFIWFIIAFLYDGNSYKELKNTYDPYHHERTTEKVPVDKENKYKQEKAPVEAQKEGALQ